MDKERLYQEVDSARWEPDGSFSDHPVIGNKGHLCLIIPSWVGGRNDPVYELHDVEKNLSYGCNRSRHPRKQQSYFGSTEVVRPRKSGVTPTEQPSRFRENCSSRQLRERHKDKEQDAYTLYSTEALILRSLVKHSQGHSAPAKQ
jgi:hypothetical protein